ncbi:HEXXH motif domain-containing protein [Streptomyces sp. CC219B]|uniref:HEXXH motif domain-containing protein n=1 Tax=Streptomyces sp. CC219B TaxID=3044574 RepID=UPI0024A7AE09|nr:HEXXH motif domain-containing protein [Streptomyces sp. CC219B]
MRHHRLDHACLELLCSAGERAEVTRVLLDAEYSRRLLLLRLLVDEAAARPAAAGALPPVGEAWQLLARAQRRHPAAVRRLLMDPQVGLWAAHVLRRLRGSADDDAPLWTDVGRLHALAASGAVLAGLDFRMPVPARAGTVLLPCLGQASCGTREPWALAEVSAHGGATRVGMDGGHTVDVPADATTDTENWSAVRRLTTRHRDLVLTLTVDDLALYPVIAGTAGPARLDEAELRRWQLGLDRAWTLLVEDHRDSAEALAAGLLSLVPLPPGERFRPRSASASEAFGCVMLSAPDPGVPEQEATAELAVTLVHEFRHTLLNGLMHLAPLTEDCADLFHAPWRDDPRPLTGILHGAFAFSGVARFWRTRCARDTGSARERARFEFALWRRQARTTLETLDTHPALTATGRKLVRGLLADLRSWDDRTLPESALLLAERAAAHQRAAWRAHHVVPDEETVRATADSWLSGGPPPRTVADGTVRTDPDGCRLDVFAHLVRLSIADPPAFSAARTTDPAAVNHLKGVTPADVAHVAGDLAEARALYARQTATRPGSWGGLGLLLADRHRALGERPELLRAVSRAVTRRSGQAVPPAELAEWLARAWNGDGSPADAHSGSGSMSQSARCSQSTA